MLGRKGGHEHKLSIKHTHIGYQCLTPPPHALCSPHRAFSLQLKLVRNSRPQGLCTRSASCLKHLFTGSFSLKTHCPGETALPLNYPNQPCFRGYPLAAEISWSLYLFAPDAHTSLTSLIRTGSSWPLLCLSSLDHSGTQQLFVE